MTSTLTVVLVVFLLLVLLAVRVPIAFTLIASGSVGLLLVDGYEVASRTVARAPLGAVSGYTLIVIPMFVAMGIFARQAGLGERVFALLARRLGRIPGGLAMATVFSCAGFGAVSGSSVATVAAMGQMSIREMLRYGYSKPLAGGVIASAGTLGVLIPPSIVLVVYGVVTGESIGPLLLAGLVPGLLSAAVYAGLIAGYAVLRPGSAGRVADKEAFRPHAIDKERFREDVDPSTRRVESAVQPLRGKVRGPRSGSDLGVVFRILILFVIVVGGIYSGIMTPTESASLGALCAFLILLFDRRVDGWAKLAEHVRVSSMETLRLVSMIFALIVGSTLFAAFIVRARLPRAFADWAASLEVSPYLVVIILLVALIPLGMFLDGLSMLLITMPLAYPAVTELGFDGIWFGILAVKVIELGLITPPVGINVYVVAGVTDQITVEQAFRGVTPFYIADVATVALLFAFPGLITWLPSLM